MKTSYNNCMTWALWQWFKHGGYLVIRRAKVPGGWFPHFLYKKTENSPMLHFVPVRTKVWMPWPVFKGYVKKKDWTRKEKP